MYDVCCVCVLARRWALTGTLDPVRNLTGLTRLSVYSNRIGGMFLRTSILMAADFFLMVVVVLVYGY